MRQVNEPVRILRSRADMLLNSKTEFHQAPLTRLVALTGLQGDQGEDQVGAFPRAGARGRPGASLGRGNSSSRGQSRGGRGLADRRGRIGEI